MATVNVEVNDHIYVVGCEDGQEPHVEALAKEFDARVREVASQVGKVTELRLFLMAALVLADENADFSARLADGAPPPPAPAPSPQLDTESEARAARAIEAAAARIEALAEGV